MRTLTASDYLVEFLIANGVRDVWGYQGGMIAYVFDSLGCYRDQIRYHSCGSEQGAALAACADAQATGRLGVAISTSGPGFTNLLTGMADAWFDSLPVLFISGNVNTKDKRRQSGFRQNGFQEIQATPMAAPVTKMSVEVELDMDFAARLDEAVCMALGHRRGPVFLDLPINICRETVEFCEIGRYAEPVPEPFDASPIIDELIAAARPIVIAGAGIKQAGVVDEFRELVHTLGVPVATTMPAIDLLPSDDALMMGYIGGTARREAGIALQNADFVLSMGTRLCSKQVGHNMALFAPEATGFVRVDVDTTEFERRLKSCERDVCADLRAFVPSALTHARILDGVKCRPAWTAACIEVKSALEGSDITPVNEAFKVITRTLPEEANLIFDVGKNLNYGCQSSMVKKGMHVFMSAGLGTMGYAIPAAMGAWAGNGLPTFAFTGDGGAQMNIQELNTIAKEGMPIKIVVFNNHALGNIRIFQENYLGSRFVATMEAEGDYHSCDLAAIARAYGIRAYDLADVSDFGDYGSVLTDGEPALFQINYEDCAVLPGIVAGGDYLGKGSGLDQTARGRAIEAMKGAHYEAR